MSQRRVRESNDGRGYTLIQVTEPEGDAERVIWQVKLEQYRSIRLAELAGPDRVVVVCEKRVRFFEVGKATPAAAYDTEHACGAVIDPGKRIVHVLWGFGRHLDTFSLDSTKRVKQLEPGKMEYVDHLRIGPDGRLLSYFMDDSDRKHGYHRIDPRNGKLETFLLPHPPTSDFDRMAPTHDGNVGVTVCWEVDADLVLKVMFIDLTTLEVSRIVPVRTFAPRELECDASDARKAARALRGDERGEDHDEAVAHLVGNLNTIAAAGDGGFWLCFRSGILRKVWPDGRVSPLFVARQAPDAGDMHYFHSHLAEVTGEHLIVNEHSEQYRVPLAALPMDSKEERVRFKLEAVPARELRPLRKKAVAARAVRR